jgi:hypothetical protein
MGDNQIDQPRLAGTPLTKHKAGVALFHPLADKAFPGFYIQGTELAKINQGALVLACEFAKELLLFLRFFGIRPFQINLCCPSADILLSGGNPIGFNALGRCATITHISTSPFSITGLGLNQ